MSNLGGMSAVHGTNDNGVVWCVCTELDPHLCADISRRLRSAAGATNRRPVAIVRPGRVHDEMQEWALLVHLRNWDVREIRHCLSHGACSFMTDACGAGEIAQAILAASTARATLPSRVLAAIVEVDPTRRGRLDNHDRRILELAATGANQPTIAATLNWSERTIRRRLTDIQMRLGATSTIEAVAIAASRGELRQRRIVDFSADQLDDVVALPAGPPETNRDEPDMWQLTTGDPAEPELSSSPSRSTPSLVKGS